MYITNTTYAAPTQQYRPTAAAAGPMSANTGLARLVEAVSALSTIVGEGTTVADNKAGLMTNTPSPDPSEQAPPMGFPTLRYDSDSKAALVPTPADRAEWHGGIGTPPEVGQLADAGVSNMFTPAWQTAVANAASANGGLGNPSDGFLAFSREVGFVRYYNPNLTAEQNRRLAEISLSTGWPIERLPGGKVESGPGIADKAAQLIEKYDSEMRDFYADPSNGVSVKVGRSRFRLDYDQSSGLVGSHIEKRHGGLRGIIDKNKRGLSSILGIASLAANFIPYVGPLVSQGLSLGQQAVEKQRIKDRGFGVGS